MSERIRQRLVLHIGLHKTGTTSFQVACADSRDALKYQGILYPDLPAFNGGTKQHVLIVPLLRSAGGCASLVKSLQDLTGRDESTCVLLSAEELSTFFIRPHDAASAKSFMDSLDRHFEEWQAYAVVREGPEMLKSLLLQHLESEGYPRDLREKAVAVRRYQSNQCLSLKQVLGDRLTAIDYGKIPKATFCRSLLKQMTGVDVALPEVRTNISADKPFKWILSADIRRLWNDVLHARHPYSAEVTAAVARTIGSLQIDPAEEERLRHALTAKMDAIAEEVMNQPGDKERLMDSFNNPTIAA